MCIDANVAVFLDLRQDRYLSAALPLSPEACTRLLEMGVLQRANPRDILSLRSAHRLVRLAHWPAFIVASAWARAIVSRRRIDLGLAELTKLAAKVPKAKSARETADLLNEVFERLRPFSPGARVCLVDSLALARFLLSRGVHSEFVFGVRVRPFSAHCWIEAHGAALNDRTGQAGSFQIIARIRL